MLDERPYIGRKSEDELKTIQLKKRHFIVIYRKNIQVTAEKKPLYDMI